LLKNSHRSPRLVIDPSAPKTITGGMIAQAATGQSSTINGGTLKLNAVDRCRSYRLTTPQFRH
jgi:hypothetical protein